MKSKSVVLLIIITTFITVSAIISPTFAQSPSPESTKPVVNPAPAAAINLTLSPTFVNLSTNPGDAVSSELTITNNNAFRENLMINIAKYQVSDGGEKLQIVPLSKADTYGEWVQFTEDQFTVDSNQTKTVRFTIAPPEDAALGYSYAFVIRRVREQESGKTTAITGAPAFTVLLDVRSPNAKRELQLISFQTDRSVYEYLPTTFNVTMRNTGNIHIVPHGDIFVDWGNKKDIAILRINEGQGNILPGAIRTYSAVWTDGFAVRTPQMKDGKVIKNDKGEIKYKTTYDFTKANRFRIGSYRANLLAVYDNGTRDIPLEARLSFWVFPWKMALLAIVIVAFTLIGLKNTVLTGVKKIRRQ